MHPSRVAGRVSTPSCTRLPAQAFLWPAPFPLAWRRKMGRLIAAVCLACTACVHSYVLTPLPAQPRHLTPLSVQMEVGGAPVAAEGEQRPKRRVSQSPPPALQDSPEPSSHDGSKNGDGFVFGLDGAYSTN